jgi:ferredoxin
MKILYFTATGNSLYIAKRLGGELISIPQAVKAGKYEFSDDKIGFVFPVYWITVPLYIEQFLREVKLNSNYIFAILTYGMVDGAAPGHLLKIAAECGIEFSYINSLKMVDNYLPNFNMKNQIENEPKKQIEQHLNTLISDINNSKRQLTAPSYLDKLMSAVMHKSSEAAIGAGLAKNFRVEDTCNQCGICAIVCPLDNIKVDNAMPQFGTRCMSCLACTHNCPKNSIRLKNERSKVRFRNRNVTLKEIAEANK